MIKIIGIAVICLILSMLLKHDNKVFALIIVICGAVAIFAVVCANISDVFSLLLSVENSVGAGSAYIKLMLKILGISITAQIICDICRDNGEGALATQTETASKIAVLAMLLPLFETIIKIVTGLTK